MKATADGGALLVNEENLVTVGPGGIPRTVQPLGALDVSAVALDAAGQIWVGGTDDGLVVARFDESHELARGVEPRVALEMFVQALPEPDGGALLISVGDGVRLEHVDDQLVFGAPIELDVQFELPSMRLHEGGFVLATTRDADAGHLTAFDRDGTQLWRTALPLPIFPESNMLVATSVIGDLLYVQVMQVDYAPYPPQPS
jgi:hypothetical protein